MILKTIHIINNNENVKDAFNQTMKLDKFNLNSFDKLPKEDV